VNVPNPGYKLKPEMFVHAGVHSKPFVSGKVPEEQEAPLLVPASAPLITGTRAVAYVAVPEKEGVFEGKEIVLGPRVGDYYIVKEGLEEGEKVVVNGAFKLDSDLQIQAKPSMMSPEGGAAPGHHHAIDEARESRGAAPVPTAFRESIDAVADVYFDIHYALSSDSLTDAQKGTEKLLEKLAKVDMKLLSGNAHMEWMNEQKRIENSSRKLGQSKDIEDARIQFEILSEALTTVIRTFSTGKTEIYRFHCPMAFDNKGAYWLQKDKDTRNPYFGASMLLCKDSVEPLLKEK
jgi:Cu(I)/Ag(I) efflux system membrane fusion protein